MDLGSPIPHDADSANSLLMRLLACPGVTGEESPIAELIKNEIASAGVPLTSILQDDAHKKMGMASACGNVWAYLNGTRSGPPLVFSTHMDTVPLCRGAVPVLNPIDRVIRPASTTALGGDNRTGCAVLINLIQVLCGSNQSISHPPLIFLFTVREESGLHGARHLDPSWFRGATIGFNVDGGAPGRLVIGAVGAQRWEAEISGIASHAGVHPDKGVSATLIMALALAEVRSLGFFGKVSRDGREGSSNVGIVSGRGGGAVGEATNVVTDFASIRGESRSTDPKLVDEITDAYRRAFQNAVNQVRTTDGRMGSCQFNDRVEYDAFRLPEDHEVVKRAISAGNRLGIKTALEVSRGGLDANWLVRHGLNSLTFGAGQHEIHTVNEFVSLDEFHEGCRLAIALAIGS